MKDLIKVEFEMEQMMCSNCKKSSSEYYELKLQIRFDYFITNNDITNIKDRVYELIDKNHFKYNKKTELDSGIDFYFKSLNDMNKLSNLFNKNFIIEEKKSKKIVGHNFLKSKDIWRYTLLIKILNINIGDRIQIKGEDYYIKAFNKNDLVLRGIPKGEKKVVTYSIIKDYFKLIEKNYIKKQF